MKHRFVVRSFPHDISKLSGFPNSLDGVIRGVKSKAMGVKMGVTNSINGPRRLVDKLGPREIAG